MNKTDYDYLLKRWKELADNLISVNDSLREVIEAQQQTILKLQGIQSLKEDK